MLRTLILDNYDSFTYNLFQYVAELGGNPLVYKNDKIALAKIAKLKPTHIIISPGPGTPVKKEFFGICGDVIRKYAGRRPILGVCLGHQGIIHVFGGRVIRAPYPMHGKASLIGQIRNGKKFVDQLLFKHIPEKFYGMRYHSLLGEMKSLPPSLEVTCETVKDHLIMGIQHKTLPIYGVQFHIESIGTPYGKKMLENFLHHDW